MNKDKRPHVQSGWIGTGQSKPSPGNHGTWPTEPDPSNIPLIPDDQLDTWTRDSIDAWVNEQLTRENETERFT